MAAKAMEALLTHRNDIQRKDVNIYLDAKIFYIGETGGGKTHTISGKFNLTMFKKVSPSLLTSRH
jgi:hypothetical protein